MSTLTFSLAGSATFLARESSIEADEDDGNEGQLEDIVKGTLKSYPDLGVR